MTINTGLEEIYLGFETHSLETLGAYHTATEIEQQPRLWKNTFSALLDKKDELSRFLATVLAHDSLQIIFTGAGSSAFIGSALEGPFQARTGKASRAVATTELLTHPDHYFTSKPTLLISFARSGDSPESVAAVKLAESHCSTIYNLIITCNPRGKLATENQNKNSFIHIMPAGSEDQGLAMTGSFTAMMLAGLLISRIDEIETLTGQLDLLCNYGNRVIEEYSGKLRSVADIKFQRAVFLGSGPFKAIASEAALKVQELTDGAIICKDDSFLSFRHGPKAVINSTTLLVYLFSNNDYVNQYESDLVNSINAGEKGICQMGVEEATVKTRELDVQIQLGRGGKQLEEDFLAIVSVLPAQILGFYKSIQLGMQPDNPSKNQTITRVVKGVKIYPYTV